MDDRCNPRTVGVRREIVRGRSAIPIILASVCACALAGCFSFSDLSGGENDSGAEGGPVDAGLPTEAAASGPCDFNAPFNAPVKLAIETSANDDYAARLSADQLFMFFARGYTDGGGAIFSASRADTSSPFSGVAPVSSLGSGSTAPSVTADGLTLLFEEFAYGDTAGSFTSNIYFAARPNTLGNFDAPQIVSNINAADAQATAPFVRADGQALYFTKFTGGSSQIYRATLTTEGFSNPTPVDELNAGNDSTYPTVTPDDLTIFWVSVKTNGDIFTAHRASANGPFVDIRAVNELNTSDEEVPSWISPDACTLYFARESTSGVESVLYAATRAPGVVLTP
jgi:hypothetical protein